MSTNVNAIVVGIFKEEALAEDAVDELRSIGFGDDQITLAAQENNGEMHRIRDTLERMGVPEEEVDYYTSEFEAGRSILLVKHGDRRSEALGILYLNSARSHKYLNKDRSSVDAPLSTQEELNDQVRATQSSSSNSWSKNFSKQDAEATESEDIESLRRLLKDAGLDYLL
ncbi:MAG: hypothetical protein ACRDIV_04090 [Ktedonobacteraceae bacterium]